MGWFDNEQQEGKPAAPAPQSPSTPARPPASSSSTSSNNPAPSSDSGSTLGRNINIDGTIVCDEDLTILGHVDGTIRAKGTLVIAKEADVHAKIDGQRVIVHGKVDGNVQGEERVVLGDTARLIGNIETPKLEIVEGAYFKGNVDMKPAKAEPAKKPAPAPAASAATPKKEEGKSDKAPAPGPSMGEAKKEEPAAAQKQATT